MPNFIMLVGLPAVGKDTWAREYIKTHANTVIHSSDDIREELYGDASCQDNPQKVFEIMCARTIKSLQEGKDVIYNATNLKYKNRRSILTQVKKQTNATCHCKVFAALITECMRRNTLRKRQVPNSVIERMARQWQTPCEWEGFKDIELYSPLMFSYEQLFAPMVGFNQNNPHHTLTLDKHCEKVYDYLVDTGAPQYLRFAGCLHDCGKPFTETKDVAGVSHYYDHESYGSYLALLLNDKENRLRISQLITWHMAPHNAQYWNKMKKVMDENFVKDIEALHCADRSAK